jgi:triacylglycerol lipase
MSLLPPALAAALADGVYGANGNPLLDVSVGRGSVMEAQERSLLLRCEPHFSIRAPASGDQYPFARGFSGDAPSPAVDWMAEQLRPGTFSPVESDFGYVATGNGDWHRHMIVVTRGTMGAQGVSADWLSNYNIGLRPGPGGRMVHAGFHRIWAQFRDFVRTAVTTHSPTHIHCVGHSLGGALASLNALMLAQMGHHVSLYTFGAPRVGTLDYATEASARLAGRIKRVYHPADPVPMIPLLPFLHAPLNSGIRLPAPGSALVNPDAHNMKNSYERLVGRQDWGSLENANAAMSDFQIDLWMRQAAVHRGGFLMRSGALLETIGRALGRLIAKAAIYVIGSGLSAAVTATLTSLDFIAWLLARAAAMYTTIKEELTGLVNAIFGFLGRVANSMVELTRTALRWVLDLLFSFLASAARNAIERLR